MRVEESYPNSVVQKHLEEDLEVLIRGDVCLTEGVRNVRSWRFSTHGFSKQEADELFKVFVGVDSETDNFPLGEVRKFWAQEALDRYDNEREQCESHYRDWVMASAEKLLESVKTQYANSRYSKFANE